jgi:flagellar export protein FliJ
MARRFRFRLEQVLNLRKQVEEIRVRELAQAKGKLLEIESAIKAHAQEEKDFLGMYGDFEKSAGFTTNEVMAYVEFKDWLLRREKEYRKQERDWSQEVERRRQAAVKASRARQLLENLKERQVRTHAQEVLGEEQRFLDEISSIAYVRRDRSKLAANAGLAEKSGR